MGKKIPMAKSQIPMAKSQIPMGRKITNDARYS